MGAEARSPDHGGAPDVLDPTRERLLDAAVEVFLEKGYGGTRVQDIARRAGFTSGALYSHFEGRADLLSEAIGREGRRRLADLVAELGPEPDVGRLAQVVAGLLEGGDDDADRLVLEALADASRGGGGEPLWGAAEALLDAIDRGCAGRGPRSAEVDARRSLVVSALVGSLVLRVSGYPRPTGSADVPAVLQRLDRAAVEG